MLSKHSCFVYHRDGEHFFRADRSTTLREQFKRKFIFFSLTPLFLFFPPGRRVARNTRDRDIRFLSLPRLFLGRRCPPNDCLLFDSAAIVGAKGRTGYNVSLFFNGARFSRATELQRPRSLPLASPPRHLLMLFLFSLPSPGVVAHLSGPPRRFLIRIARGNGSFNRQTSWPVCQNIITDSTHSLFVVSPLGYSSCKHR